MSDFPDNIPDSYKAVLESIKTESQKLMETCAKEMISRTQDYFRFNDFETDVSMNLNFAATDAIEKMLRGEDFHPKHWATGLWPQVEKIRTHIWEKYADEVVKASMGIRDKEISELKSEVSKLKIQLDSARERSLQE